MKVLKLNFYKQMNNKITFFSKNFGDIYTWNMISFLITL